MKQKIIGAKAHGISRTFYRVFPHVKTGANLACEVLLHEIESRMDYCLANDKPFPRVFFCKLMEDPKTQLRLFMPFVSIW